MLHQQSWVQISYNVLVNNLNDPHVQGFPQEILDEGGGGLRPPPCMEGAGKFWMGGAPLFVIIEWGERPFSYDDF